MYKTRFPLEHLNTTRHMECPIYTDYTRAQTDIILFSEHFDIHLVILFFFYSKCGPNAY